MHATPVRAIAVDIDDTLNDFTETLRRTPFPFDPSYALAEERFTSYLERVRNDVPEPGELLSTEYSYFRQKLHAQCYRLAAAREGGAAFLHSLRGKGWRIVICTGRDLRRVGEATRLWLKEQGIPFDDLFMAQNKIAFCRAWGIPHLVDDEPFTLLHGQDYGVGVYYPVLERHGSLPSHSARGFRGFDELMSWIEK